MEKILSKDVRRIVVLDVIAIGIMYLVPTLSHLVSLPLYKFEPMRIVLLANFLLLTDKRNAYIMAITLPLFSFAVGNHPVLLKAVLMGAELALNIFLFTQLSKKIRNNGVSMFLSIVLSKIAYYAVKFTLIFTGIWATNMIGTELIWQVVIAIVLSLLFMRFSKSEV